MGLVLAFARQRLAERAPIDPPMLVAERVSAPQPSSVAPRRAAVLERRVPPPPSALPRPHSFLPLAPSSRSNVALPPAEPPTDATCRCLASQAPERAVECYQTIARESSIGAQVALYEAARLSAEVLGDAPRALALLEQHAARFPNGVLRVEVDWLKIRSLERAGRLDEALSASEALLDSAVGRTLAPKLHLLRGRIYAEARHQCALALPEYVALLGEPGPAGDEAEFKRARCLEQLHEPDRARAAYQRYLERADARSAEAARARLIAISSTAPASEGQP
ncbi:MAG TPA: tetratricopeptide repeat protein [Polyangiaceae bacterium]